MKQFLALAAVTVAASVGTLTAGTVLTEIGDGTNGLTQAYIQNGAPGSPTNPNLIQGSLVSSISPLSAFFGKSYDGRLFQAANLGAQPYTPYNPLGAQTGQIGNSGNAFDAGVTFQMINNGCTNSAGGPMQLTPTIDACGGGASDQSLNVWMATSAGTITIPIGIADATDVYTMLDNLWGVAGAIDTSISFTFGTSSNDTSGDTKTLTLMLTNASNNSNGPGSGQIGTALECAGVGVCKDTSSLTYATGPLAATSTVTAMDGMTQVTVNTGTVFSTAFNNATGKFVGATGNAVLSDQDFELPFYSADPYLVSVSIAELNGTNNVSATTLSAITVESTTPEPSTILMLLTGIGAVAAIQLRRRRPSVRG